MENSVRRRLLDAIGISGGARVVDIPMDRIEPSRYQPRIHFDEQALRELAVSIQENGLIQPITVREVDGHYEIIAGERRWRAAKLAGLDRIAGYVLSPSETQAAEMALVENIQREDLTAVEEAKAYVQIMRQSGMTQEQVAARVGKSQSAVANKIRLLNLNQSIQEAVMDRTLSERHARALLALKPEQQENALKYVTDRGLNVRQTEAYVEKLTLNQSRKKRQKTRGYSRNIRIGINSVNQCIQMIKNMGIDVVSDMEETDTDVRISIRFPK